MTDLAPPPPQGPALTVLVPTRDRFQLLSVQARSLHLLLTEAGASFEIIVHDNSTKAPPPGLVEALPSSVRYIRSPEVFDTAEENICEAFDHCRGEYVWLLADDDGVEPAGLRELLDAVARGEDDIIVFNSRHGRDERLAGEGAYLTQRARRFFYEKEMRCSIATFVERTGFFYWLCAISTVVVRREAAPVAPLRKYLSIARIYAHVAWLIEIGKDKRFLFVNRPLVVYGLLPTDHDGGRHWRSVGVREGGYSNAVWTGLWLRVLDELIAQAALTLDQVRRTTEMNHATRFHFGSNLAHQVLEQLGEMPELMPPEDLALATDWLVKLFPGAIFMNALVADIASFTMEYGASVLRIEQDSRADQATRAEARDLRARAAWWRRAIGGTAWYSRHYVETLHLYDIYDFGEDWVAAHASFGSLSAALEVIDLPSLPPVFLRASTYDALQELVQAQPLKLDTLRTTRTAALALPAEWERLTPESPSTHVHVSPTAVVAPNAPQGEVAALRVELDRQDAQLSQIYASRSWRFTGWLRRLVSVVRPTRLSAHPTAPTLDMGLRLDLSSSEADVFLPRGFSGSEDWGRWTDGPTAVFRCRHATRDALGELEVWAHMLWTRDGAGPVVFSVSVNGGKRTLTVVEAGACITVPLSPKTMAESQLEVAFHISDPKRPEEAPTSDQRRLGLGLAAVRLRFVDDAPAAGA